MNTACAFCGHKHLQSSQTQYIYRHDDKFLIVDDVPCLQCAYCGEQYFAGPVLQSIEKKFNDIYVHGQKASKEVQIPVEHFPNLQPA
jgi:YgiT-type zinc finger domain-containing protein